MLKIEEKNLIYIKKIIKLYKK